MRTKPPQEPPQGCQEIPGYILPIRQGGWLTQNLTVTHIWQHRGIWPTPEAAQAALDKAVEIGTVLP